MFPLADYTLARDGSDTLRRVLARVWPLLVRALFEVPSPPPPLAAPWQRLMARARVVAPRDPAALVRALRRPSLAARLQHARHVAFSKSADYGDALAPALVELALDAAAARWLGETLALERPGDAWPAAWAPALGEAFAIAPTVETLTLTDGALTADGASMALTPGAAGCAGVTRAAAWVPVDGRLTLALVDDNPLAQASWHPERAANAVDLGGRDVDAWRAALREALSIVEHALPTHAAERRLLAQVVVPVGVDAERHFSCSYENAPGAMYLSLHPDPVKMAEALVHEFQHDKLHALLRLDPLIDNDRDATYRSPVRPDARPLHGVLLAAHAFLAVAAMYRAMRDAGHDAARHRRFAARVDEVRAANVECMAMLDAHAKPTALGAQLLAEMRTLAP